MPDYKNYYLIPAPPEEIFIALTNPATLQLWTGEPAIMSTEAESEFSLWDGSITGKNIGFETGKKIVQEWYFGDNEQPSIVTLLLHPHKHGASIELRHSNIPEDAFNDIVEGWNDVYFAALLDFYET